MGKAEILIVEDESLIAEDLKTQLQTCDYSVAELCSTAEQALQLIEDSPPDLVLIDIVLAGEMDGIEAARQIWNQHKIPLIYITAHPEDSYRERVKKTEAFGYLTKPIQQKDLRNNIEFALYKNKMESKLRCNEARLKRVQKLAEVGSWEIDPETEQLTWSEVTHQIFGVPPEEEVHYDDFLEFIHPADRDFVDQQWKQALETGDYEVEHRIVVDGKTKWVREKAEIKFNPNGQPSEVLGSVQDITEQKRTEEQLRAANQQLEAANQQLQASEQQLRAEIEEREQIERELRKKSERFRLMARNIDQNFFLLAPDLSEVLYTNKNVEILHGVLSEEVYEDPLAWTRYVPDSDREKLKAIFAELKAGDIEDSVSVEYRVEPPERDRRHIRADIYPVYEGNKLIRFVGVDTDITERKKRETELKKLSRAVEQSPATVVITDPDGSIEYVNPYFRKLTGYRPEEVQGENPCVLKSGQHSSKFYSDLWETITAGEIWRGEFHNQKKNGELYWEDASIAPVKDDSGEITNFIKVAEDITERRRARNNLRKINECFLNFTPDPLENIESLVELCGELASADMVFYNWLEEGQLQIRAGWQVPGEFYSATQPEGHVCYDVICEEGKEVEIIDNLQETEYAAKNSLIQELDLRTYIGRKIELGKESVGALCVIFKEGAEVSVELKTIVELIASALEVEEERLLVENRLKRSNRELKHFANMATHDLKQPLRTVSSYIELLGKRYSEVLDEQAGNYIERATNGVRNMKKLLDGLMEYTRVQMGADQFQPVEIEALLSEVLADLEVKIQESGTQVNYRDLPVVRGDKRLLARLFQNLISNAITYSKEDVPPVIEVDAMVKADKWEFSVSDNGIGIEPDYQDKIFKIFERLHTEDEIPGTGIGLSVCKKIVNEHDGKIWVKSAPGEGATFYFTLPVVR